ncbi:hypothetical protein [Helicobacter sp. CLO-3]|nr:hypothetical protein [Helicobacter sp. CLO-3]
MFGLGSAKFLLDFAKICLGFGDANPEFSLPKQCTQASDKRYKML